jgi:tetratricopeptide (TPR) repeat protein
MYLKRIAEALETYEMAIQLNPADARACNGKGMTLFALKRYQEALTAYEQAIELDPNNALFHYNKGEALRYLGKQELAEQARQRARQLGYYASQHKKSAAATARG